MWLKFFDKIYIKSIKYIQREFQASDLITFRFLITFCNFLSVDLLYD